MSREEIEIEILDWLVYHNRPEVKQSRWFRMEHTFFESSKFFCLNNNQRCFWIYLVCQAAKQNNLGTLYFNIDHAKHLGRFDSETIINSLELFENIGLIQIPERARNTLVADKIVEVTGTGKSVPKIREEKERKGKEYIAGKNSPRQVYSPEFDQLWILYNRKGDKKKAYLEFRKQNLNEGETQELTIAIKNYFVEKPDPQFRKDFENFLKMDWRDKLTLVEIKPYVPKTKQQLLHEKIDAYGKDYLERMAKEKGKLDS